MTHESHHSSDLPESAPVSLDAHTRALEKKLSPSLSSRLWTGLKCTFAIAAGTAVPHAACPFVIGSFLLMGAGAGATLVAVTATPLLLTAIGAGAYYYARRKNSSLKMDWRMVAGSALIGTTLGTGYFLATGDTVNHITRAADYVQTLSTENLDQLSVLSKNPVEVFQTILDMCTTKQPIEEPAP